MCSVGVLGMALHFVILSHSQPSFKRVEKSVDKSHSDMPNASPVHWIEVTELRGVGIITGPWYSWSEIPQEEK